MIVVIDTQYMENYGTAEEPYWKFKGGHSYKIVGVPAGVSDSEVVMAVAGKIEYRNDYSEEYILGHSVEEDGWQSDFERSQLEYDGEILFPEPVIQWAEVDNTRQMMV